MKSLNSPEAVLLLEILDQGYERQAWHGPNLKSSLRGVTAQDAMWRPGHGRHNIWEIAVHAAYWKYVVRGRLWRERGRGFPLQGRNWFASPSPLTEQAWRQARELLEQTHRSLRAAVAELPRSPARKLPTSMIFGVAFHDIYHAGQIRLLRRLRAAAKRRRR
jgi:hypothetical protein